MKPLHRRAESTLNRPGVTNSRSSIPEIEIPIQPEAVSQTWPVNIPIRHGPGLKRVLIVDDDDLVRASIGAILECEGYAVFDAANGYDAVKGALRFQPDLVLLDLNMPNLDGWNAFVKLEHVRPLIPVIVITARPHQYEHAVRLGVDAFMEKPLNFPALLRAIHTLTHEPEDHHTRRITRHNFTTLRLDDDRPRTT